MPHSRVLVGLVAASLIMLLSAGAQAAPVAPTDLPEPASLGLFAVGAAALAWVKFRRRK